MRSTMLMPVEWAVARNTETAKLTTLAGKLQHDPYCYPGLHRVHLPRMSCIDELHTN